MIFKQPRFNIPSFKIKKNLYLVTKTLRFHITGIENVLLFCFGGEKGERRKKKATIIRNS